VQQAAGRQRGAVHQRGQLVLAHAGPYTVDERLDGQVGQRRTASRPGDLLVALDQAQLTEGRGDVDQRPLGQEVAPVR